MVAAIEQCGATPVFVDIVPATFAMASAHLHNAITPKPHASSRHPADLAPVLQIANQYGIPVLEDCTQAHGAIYRGKQVVGGSYKV